MSADQKIRQYPIALASAPPVLTPDAACRKMRFARQRLDPDFVAFEEIALRFEVNYRRVNATASQETHETTSSTLAPESPHRALERII
jgi:hypothetical protein